jgi:hypothetical protein
MTKTIWEFTVKKTVLHSGREVLTPMARQKCWFLPNQWCRISCLYGIYTLMDLDFTPQLTYDECVAHIHGYQQVLQNNVANTVKYEEYHEFTEYKIEETK